MCYQLGLLVVRLSYFLYSYSLYLYVICFLYWIFVILFLLFWAFYSLGVFFEVGGSLLEVDGWDLKFEVGGRTSWMETV